MGLPYNVATLPLLDRQHELTNKIYNSENGLTPLELLASEVPCMLKHDRLLQNEIFAELF